MNGFSHKSDSDIATLASNAAFRLAQFPSYKVPTVVADALGEAGEDLASLVGAARSAQDAAKAATISKLEGRATALSALSAVANIVYLNGTTDSELQALGFSPRATPSRPSMPLTVADLTTTIDEDGVRASWKKNGNRATAIYQLEGSSDGGATWTILSTTLQAKITLSDLPVGVPIWLRVTTKNSLGTSLPSNTVGVYVSEGGGAEPIRLKLAV